MRPAGHGLQKFEVPGESPGRGIALGSKPQADRFFTSCEENSPGPQGWQNICPGFSATVPSAQALHVVEPGTSWKVPAGQSTQTIRPFSTFSVP